ncbi:hypothetical protein BDP27DRAFT_1366417 [Rhodocollybia butyracea]|uniref:Uncharacterized protein n=1 Tax=Rhodocollybia butyracea TaxID=206335 RepID=A0A9P5U535_9AGAR|nr:hypothetical protein BDP27DRAFT_1366417 [Rhodocollybia butyracea]
MTTNTPNPTLLVSPSCNFSISSIPSIPPKILKAAPNSTRTPSTSPALYPSLSVLFPTNFDFVKGRKLPGITPRKTNNPPLSALAPNLSVTPPGGSPVAAGTSCSAVGRVRQVVRLNTPGVPHGGFELWVEGRRDISRSLSPPGPWVEDKKTKCNQSADTNEPSTRSGGLFGPGSLLGILRQAWDSNYAVALEAFPEPDDAHGSMLTSERKPGLGIREPTWFEHFFGGHEKEWASPRERSEGSMCWDEASFVPVVNLATSRQLAVAIFQDQSGTTRPAEVAMLSPVVSKVFEWLPLSGSDGIRRGGGACRL